MSEEKKAIIVDELEFDALRHIPNLNVTQAFEGTTPWTHSMKKSRSPLPKIRDALGLNVTKKIIYKDIYKEQKQIVESFKNSSLSFLTKSSMEMSLDEDENQLKFKRTFILFIQKCFLLPTIINKIFSVYTPAIFHVDTI
ncbi:hypothetical protein Ahy_B02g059925 [Arachis hypogaea]|uniref:Uncharacterized protein n=1 Tax=Arachis hypogaea TaxID=3818 RepID=A0A445AHN5_ARAHY|nr:hypothetical protein Ahy_B02g059925 [Arachis hypogaea]